MQVELGSVLFLINAEADPDSASAKEIATAVATTFNERLFEATAQGQFPGYVVTAEVKEIRRGSLLVDLLFRADVILGGITVTNAIVGGIAATGAAKFVKDYSKLREGILAIAKDIKTVSAKTFLFFSREFTVELQANKLLTPEQMEIQVKHALLALEAEAVKARQEAEAEAEAAAAKAETARASSSPSRWINPA